MSVERGAIDSRWIILNGQFWRIKLKMLTNTDGLSIIASKSPVVATHIGDFNESSAKQTQQRYIVEASTYVRPHEIWIYQEKFLDRLINNKTSIGCIVAPFGYGK